MNVNLAAAAEATSGFVNMDEARGILALALVGAARNPLRKNLIFWGPGGYGKSEFTHTYISAAIGTPPYVISMHREMSAAEMFGGIDVPAMQSGILRYRVEDSYMAHPVAQFEEALDAPDSLLLSNKDIMTRREFTIGQKYQVKTHLIVINTNHDPARFKNDMSKAAFLERFPYVARVDWSGVSLHERESSYAEIIRNVANGGNPIGKKTGDILCNIANQEQWSPRRLIHVVQAAQDFTAMTENSKSKTVSTDHLMAVSAILGYDTSEAIRRLEEEDLQEQVNQFNNTMSQLIGSVYQKIGQNFANHEDAAKVLREQKNMLDNFIEQSNNARYSFGGRSDEVIDALLGKIDECKIEIADRWMKVLG